MKLAIRCANCGNYFMSEENDICLEIDFKEMKISFICRNPNCKHDNIIDFSDWQKKQKHSPLPKIKIM